MAEQVEDDRRMTLDEFLVRDDGTDTRYELVDGRVVAIPLRTAPQAALVASLGIAVERRRRQEWTT